MSIKVGYSPRRLSERVSPKRVAKYSRRKLFARWARNVFSPIIAIYRSFTYQPRRLLAVAAVPALADGPAIAVVDAEYVMHDDSKSGDAGAKGDRLLLLGFCSIFLTVIIALVGLFCLPRVLVTHVFSAAKPDTNQVKSQMLATSLNIQTEPATTATTNVQTESDTSLAFVDNVETESLTPALVNNVQTEFDTLATTDDVQTESSVTVTDDTQTEFSIITATENIQIDLSAPAIMDYVQAQFFPEVAAPEQADVSAESETEESEIPARYLPVYVSVPGDFIVPGAAPGFTPIEKAHYFNLVEPMEVSETAALRLAQIIEHEVAQSWWADDELILVMGTVVLNRVASSEFPNDIESVLYAENQYLPRNNSWWRTNTPNERSVEAAQRLLAGERYAPPEVVFQANFPQGSSTWLAMKDRQNAPRISYFCTSRHPELYVEETSEVLTKDDYLPITAEIE